MEVERLARTASGRTRLYELLLWAGWDVEITSDRVAATRGDRRVEASGRDRARMVVDLFLGCMRSAPRDREEQLGWKV